MRYFLLLMLGAACVAACNHHAAAPAATVKVAEAPSTNLGKEHTSELLDVLAAYYGLKDALLASDSTKANAATSKLVSATESFNQGLGDKPEFTELHPQLELVMKAGDSILAIKTSHIEPQRAHFATISDALFKVLKIAKLQHGGVYQQHCPMAFAGKGGDWLSNEAEIKNPYFPATMLECGDVRDSL